MDAAEDRLWWYRALHAQLLDAFGQTALPPGAAVLDAGCGTGGLLKRLGAIAPERTRIGLDHEAVAATRAVRKSGAKVVLGSVDALPFADASFGAIFSADVLYHREVDPLRAAREAYRCLMPEGMLVVWSTHAADPKGSFAGAYDETVGGGKRAIIALPHAP
jgi:ubiquinone/menaquinone biosynthesis C-methylase UbiE